MYTVIHNSSIDCYKRAETFSEVIYSGNNKKAAYAFAVEQWLKLFQDEIDYPDNEDVARELADLLSREDKNDEYYEEIHTLFSRNCDLIWEPEYINSPIQEIVVTRKRPARAKYAKISKLANKVIQTVKNKGDSWIYRMKIKKTRLF